MHFSPVICCFLPFTSKYSSQHPVLKHPHSIFPLRWKTKFQTYILAGSVIILFTAMLALSLLLLSSLKVVNLLKKLFHIWFPWKGVIKSREGLWWWSVALQPRQGIGLPLRV
jgi:hypothetical protein